MSAVASPAPLFTEPAARYLFSDWTSAEGASLGLWSKIKKTVKKIAPIAGIAASFIPGVGGIASIATRALGGGAKAARAVSAVSRVAKVARTAKGAARALKVGGVRVIPGKGSSLRTGAGLAVGSVLVDEGIRAVRRITSRGKRKKGKTSAGVSVYVGGASRKKRKKKAKRKKSTRRPSAKQIAARRRFTARYGRRRR